MALASLTAIGANYSDSDGEDDRSETPELLVEAEISEVKDLGSVFGPGSSEVKDLVPILGPGSFEAKDVVPIHGPGSSKAKDFGPNLGLGSSEAEDLGHILGPGSSDAKDLGPTLGPGSSEAEDFGPNLGLGSSEAKDLGPIQVLGSSEVKDLGPILGLGSSEAKDLGPILGPHPKEEESWSYKGLLDFSKTVADITENTKDENDSNFGTEDIDPSCYSYEGELCVYTDPVTKAQFIWDDTTSAWMSRQSPNDVANNYVYDGNTYWYEDDSGSKYRWNTTTNQWENVLPECPLPGTDYSPVVGPKLPEEVPRKNDAAAYANLLIDTAPAIRSKVSGDRAARQLNHYMDYEAFERQANIGFEKPKFTKKQIQLLRRRKQEKKYKKSLEWLKKDY